jgi:hypothetical protein
VSEPPNDEVLDGLPVLPGEPSGVSMFSMPASRELTGPLSAPAQKMAAAAGGFVAGAAVLGLVHRRKSRRVALATTRSSRRLSRSRKRSKSVGELVEVVASRSFLVDVHLLGVSGRDR